MKDREELVMCNCKDNKYHNLPGWHEDFCEYRKWWENDEAAEQGLHPTPESGGALPAVESNSENALPA